jgi:DNA repair photolyase
VIIVIISASRRTDIPSYYSDWLFNRLREKYVMVRNPMNVHQIGKINLSYDVVDGIVFWTKNPIPMMDRLSEIEKYNYYFQFTVNPYGKDVEPNVPSKADVIIPAFQKLSKRIGKDRVIWRYDPILLNSTYTIEYHINSFRSMAEKLSDYTEKCTVSFIDLYKNTMRNIQPLRIQVETREQQIEILDKFLKIARSYGIYIDTCAEALDQIQIKILRAHCIDKERFERLGRYKLSIGKDKNQRVECGCIESIDIGAYNTCKNGCLYCYANYSSSSVKNNFEQHDPTSPLLFGTIGPDDVIKERAVKSCKECQMSMFE